MLLTVFATLVVLTALDGYYALADHPIAPSLARFVSLNGAFGAPALVMAALTGASCFTVLLLARTTWSDLRNRDRMELLILFGVLGLIGLIDLVPQKPPIAVELLIAVTFGAALTYVGLRTVRSEPAAPAYWIAGLALLATTSLYEWLEIRLMGNPDYYTLNVTNDAYVFDSTAWHYVWIVSRVQELSELLGMALLLVGLSLALRGRRSESSIRRPCQNADPRDLMPVVTR